MVVPQECYTLKPEHALLKFGIKPMNSQAVEHNPQMLLVLLLILGIHNDVVNKYNHERVQIRLE